MFSIRGKGLSASNIYHSRKKSTGVMHSKRNRMMSSTTRRNANNSYPEFNIAIIENRS